MYFAENMQETYYEPTNEAPEITSVVYVKQFPWEKCPLGTIHARLSGKMHIPWAHDYNAVRRFQEAGTVESRYSKTVTELPVGAIAYIPSVKRQMSEYGALVRITSEVKAGPLEGGFVVRNTKQCQHQYIDGTCVECRNSIVEVTPRDIFSHIEQGHIVEPFWTLYREVELIGLVKYTNTVKRGDLARRDAAGKKVQGWRRIQ